jgi:hypothetical protein
MSTSISTLHMTQELRAEIQAIRDKAEAKERQLKKKDADKNESERRKREDDKKEKKQEEADKALLNSKKQIAKKKAAPTKQAKKQAKMSAAGEKLKARTEEYSRKKEETEKQVEARRKELLAEGLTVRVLDDDDTVTSQDMEWDCDQWEVVDHAVDWNTGKGNFKVIIGMRAGATEATKMWMWGQRTALTLDGAPKEVVDAYIKENCEHPVYREQMYPRKVVKNKKKEEVSEIPKKKKPCDHSCYDLGLSYNADPEVNPGWCAPGKFLFGVKCAGCASPFVQKAPPAGEGSGKEPGDPQVPSTTNAVYCCNNIRNRNGTSEEGCSHAMCTPCWNEAILKASKSDDGSRASSRRGR